MNRKKCHKERVFGILNMHIYLTYYSTVQIFKIYDCSNIFTATEKEKSTLQQA